MPFGVDPNAAPEVAAPTPEAPILNDEERRELAGNTGEPETTEEVVQETQDETDEQKNARVLQERRERSERQARGVQRRIDELTADKHAERQAREAMQRQLDEAQARLRELTERPVPGQRDPNAEPDRSTYDDWEKYNRGLARWEARQVARQEVEQAQRAAYEYSQRVQYQAATAQLDAGFANTQAEFAKTRPDYFDKVAAADNVPMSRATEATIKALPNGPAVALFLAENPQVAHAIANQPDVMQGFVLGNIASHISSGKISNAPTPGRPVGGAGPASSDAPPTDTAAYNRWAAKRGL